MVEDEKHQESIFEDNQRKNDDDDDDQVVGIDLDLGFDVFRLSERWKREENRIDCDVEVDQQFDRHEDEEKMKRKEKMKKKWD